MKRLIIILLFLLAVFPTEADAKKVNTTVEYTAGSNQANNDVLYRTSQVNVDVIKNGKTYTVTFPKESVSRSSTEAVTLKESQIASAMSRKYRVNGTKLIKSVLNGSGTVNIRPTIEIYKSNSRNVLESFNTKGMIKPVTDKYGLKEPNITHMYQGFQDNVGSLIIRRGR